MKKVLQKEKKRNLFDERFSKLIRYSQFNIQNKLKLESSQDEYIALCEKGGKLTSEFKEEQERIKAENEKLKKQAKIEQDKRDKIERDRE